MSLKRFLSWVALLGGEALIIAIFMLYGKSLETNILLLNIVVMSIIYGLYFIDIFVPWVDWYDKSKKKIATIGIRWTVTVFYTVTAIIVMLACNVFNEASFNLQLILHCALLLVLVIGFASLLYSSDKTQQINAIETRNGADLDRMRLSMRSLKDRMCSATDLPSSVVSRINRLDDNLRYIAPSASAEAHDYERRLAAAITDLSIMLGNYTMNAQKIENVLSAAERIYQNRKSIY